MARPLTTARSRVLQAVVAAAGKAALPQTTISVMTYNILAQKYAQSGWHNYCPPRHLRWTYRKELLLEELEGYDTDIICLQEVEAEVFSQELRPWLAERGYRGHYLARQYGENVQGPPEGVALFYRTEVFDLVRHHAFTFSNVPTDPPAPRSPALSSSDGEDAAADEQQAGAAATASADATAPDASEVAAAVVGAAGAAARNRSAGVSVLSAAEERSGRGSALSVGSVDVFVSDSRGDAIASGKVARDVGEEEEEVAGAAAQLVLAVAQPSLARGEGEGEGDTPGAPACPSPSPSPSSASASQTRRAIAAALLPACVNISDVHGSDSREGSNSSSSTSSSSTSSSSTSSSSTSSRSSNSTRNGTHGDDGYGAGREGRGEEGSSTAAAAAATTPPAGNRAATALAEDAPPTRPASPQSPGAPSDASTSGRSSSTTAGGSSRSSSRSSSSSGRSSSSSSGRGSRGNNEFWSVFTRRQEGAILALLRHRASQRPVLAAVTHLFWNPAFPDVKAFQAAVLCREMAAFLRQHAGGEDAVAGVPVVLAGDFNSLSRKRVPDTFDPKIPRGTEGLVSGVYALLTRGVLPPDHPDHPASRRRPGETSNSDFCGVELTTSGISLDSAYRLANGREPPLTTRTATFAGCLDYIFVSPQHLDVTSTLDLPYDLPSTSYDAVRDPLNDVDFAPIPNVSYPSDHLSLVAQLRLKGL